MNQKIRNIIREEITKLILKKKLDKPTSIIPFFDLSEAENNIQSEVIFLVGLPGSGKSTYIKKLKQQYPEKDYIVLSTDDIIEREAKKSGLTYTQAFDILDREETETEFFNDIKKAVENKRNIIIDRTNMTKERREETLNFISPDYKKIALVFKIPEKELQKRLKDREEKTGKYIPPEVMQRMSDEFEQPDKSEFDEVKILKESWDIRAGEAIAKSDMIFKLPRFGINPRINDFNQIDSQIKQQAQTQGRYGTYEKAEGPEQYMTTQTPNPFLTGDTQIQGNIRHALFQALEEPRQDFAEIRKIIKDVLQEDWPKKQANPIQEPLDRQSVDPGQIPVVGNYMDQEAIAYFNDNIDRTLHKVKVVIDPEFTKPPMNNDLTFESNETGNKKKWNEPQSYYFDAVLEREGDNIYDVYPGYSKKAIKDEEYYYPSKEDAEKDIEEYIKKFEDLKFPITIHRILKLDKPEDLRKDDLGASWTYNIKDLANKESFGNYILSGKADKDAIDFEKSIWRAIMHYALSENEAVIKDTFKIKNLKIQKLDEFLKKLYKEEINFFKEIISESLKSVLNEGRYDRITGIVVDNLWKFIKYSKVEFDEDPDENELQVFDLKGFKDILRFDVRFIIRREYDIGVPFTIEAQTYEKSIEFYIEIDPDYEPESYNDLNAELQNAVRHEIEHLTQFGLNVMRQKYIPLNKALRDEINADPSRTYEYLTLPDEIPAMAHGLYRKSKTVKKPLDVVMNEFLNLFELTKKGKKYVFSKWIDFAKKHLPAAQYSKSY